MKETRKYGLFEKVNGKWLRLRENESYTKTLAVSRFQNALLAPYWSPGPDVKGPRSLRPLK